MTNFLIVSSCKEKRNRTFATARIKVDGCEDVRIVLSGGWSLEEVLGADVNCYIVIPPVAEKSLSIEKNMVIDLRELHFLADWDPKEEPESYLRSAVKERKFGNLQVRELNDESNGNLEGVLYDAVACLLSYIAKLNNLGEDVRFHLTQIAREGSLPTLPFSLEEEIAVGARPEQLSPSEISHLLAPRAHPRVLPKERSFSFGGARETFNKLKSEGERFASFEYREEQVKFALEVEKALDQAQHLIVEAGTGVGKSIGYLIPAASRAFKDEESVIISTYTKVLQEQIVNSDYPRLVELIEEEIPQPVILKGRENYLCLEKARLKLLGETESVREFFTELIEKGAGVKHHTQLARELSLCAIKLVTSSLLTMEGEFEHIRLGTGLPEESQRLIRESLNCAFRGCLRERCPLFKECYFYSQRDMAERSRLTILNHTLLFSLYHAETQPDDAIASFVDKTKLFILDEAHNLEDAILSALRADINSYEVLDFINSLLKLLENKTLVARLSIPDQELSDEEKDTRNKLSLVRKLIPEYCDQLHKTAARIAGLAQTLLMNFREGEDEIFQFEILASHEAEELRIQNELLDSVIKFDDVLREVALQLEYVAQKTVRGDCVGKFEIDDNRYQMQLSEVVNHLAELRKASSSFLTEEPSIARWIEVKAINFADGYVFKLSSCPVTVGTAFADFLSSKTSVVLVSGTLSTRGNFDFFKGTLGIEEFTKKRLREIKLKSPFDYARNTLVLIPRNAPSPDFSDKDAHQKHLAGVAELVEECGHHFRGGILVLFNSYSDLQVVADLVADKLVECGLKPLVQTRGTSRAQLVEDFKRLKGTVLLGTRSFWEGFDVRGEDLRCVLISRLPFPNIRDPITAGKIRWIESQGRNSFQAFMLPFAITKFTQGFGRLIRSNIDYGCVIVMDTRILNKSYGPSFIKNLPDPQIKAVPLEEISEHISRFLRSRRNQA